MVLILNIKIEAPNVEIQNCFLCLLSNIAFYEKQVLMMNDFEINETKQEVNIKFLMKDFASSSPVYCID